MKILITGVAGFIGFSLAKDLLENSKCKIYGIDNLDNYYSVKLKEKRIEILNNKNNFYFKKIDLNSNKLQNYLKKKNLIMFFTLRHKQVYDIH